ncbi:MAG TPA: hypothetical protein VF414_13595, partial [Thermoanaerobaculia bacterium]
MTRPSLVRKLLRPAADVLHGLDRCLDRGVPGLALALAGLVLGWWIYVPLHELLHAGACRLAGGEVTRLEIDTLYGGGLLARVFPFVAPASDYAGRLSGFDTRGSDLIYLATDFGPFVLTLFPGVWALRRAAAGRNALLFGASLPFALAPFLSLTGDAYEIGSILVTRIPPWEPFRDLLRGDDLVRKAEELRALEDAPWGGALLAALLGLAWAYGTWWLGNAVARWAGRGPVEPQADRRSQSVSGASRAMDSPPSEPMKIGSLTTRTLPPPTA